MNKPGLLVLVVVAAVLLFWLWPDGEPVDAANPSERSSAAVPLEIGMEPTGAAPPSGAEEPPAPSPEVREERPRQTRESSSAAAGLRALDAWHRELPSNVAAVTDDADIAEALADFRAMWEGQGARYAAALELEVPASLGPDFARHARAYAEGGLTSLDRSLGRGGGGPAWLAWQEALALRAMELQENALGAKALGVLLPMMVESGYERERLLGLRPLVEQVGKRCSSFLPSRDYVVQSGDSLDRICKQFAKEGIRADYRWVAEFNDKSNYNLRAGEHLKIPATPLRVRAWRGLRMIAVYAGDAPVRLYEASFGQPGEETPLGTFTVDSEVPEPPYWPPDGSPALPFGHPDNPLGTRWMGFKEKPSYGIHGTSDEATIGTYETLGCIRMRNTEVEELFEMIPRGGQVEISP